MGRSKRSIIKKNLIPMCLVSLGLVLGLTIWNGTSQKAFGSDITADNADNLKTFAALEVEKAQLRAELGQNSVYPEFSSGVEAEKLLGKDEAAAIEDTKNEIIEREALYWHAVSHGMRMTDEEVQNRIEAAIVDAETAENYQEIQDACKAAGTTFEATMLENKEQYKKEYTVSDLYNEKFDAFAKAKPELSDEDLKEWESHWQAFVDKTVEDYKKTKNFKILDKALEKSEMLVREKVTDQKEIKASDVSVYDRFDYQ